MAVQDNKSLTHEKSSLIFRFEKKYDMRILITGASGGIGRECVLLLAARKDCEVIAVSRSGELLTDLKRQCKKETGNNIHTIESDFHQIGFQMKLKKELGQMYNGIDCVINNAGVLINKSFSEINGKDIEEQFRVNFEAPLLLIQALLPLLRRKKGKGHVVNIGSMGGYQGAEKFPGLSVYSASKGALAILTESLAAEFVSDNIVFNCLALGSADTEMLRKAFPKYKSPVSSKEMAEFIVEFTLTGHKYFNGKIIPVATLST